MNSIDCIEMNLKEYSGEPRKPTIKKSASTSKETQPSCGK